MRQSTDLRIVDDDEEVLEIQPRDRGQMRKPGQQELPEPQAHEDGHEALESDVQNGELPQQEVPMLEEAWPPLLAMGHPVERGSSVTGGSNNLGCHC
ncbi:hypothetical protein EMCRGX_G000392 [Ephydatia muelleri]